ncbi:TetR family transcriptional regulator [Actinorugispora endophytica]|uniref:TetR family transcriptional regulator n=1 Tax=Actinorugispora endophytica TaxID=1605990 RepID=A0A4R6V3Q5_9ACTN|nr:TetR family transcriptional regulator [Actinorugispora endophytica]
MTVEKLEKPVRVSPRGAATRSALLEAASHVFRTVGFDRAGVSQVVAHAGASVGSLYHHFTGKADLFIALYEDFQQRQQDRTREAVARARAEGETDPNRLMNTAARAYLEGCIEEREITWLFFSGDSPPGFEATMRTRLREWTDRNVALFRKADEPVDEALLLVVSGSISLAVSEVVCREDPDDARALADEVVDRLSRLTPPRSE